MEWLQQFFGKDSDLNSLQMSVRGIIVFLAALLVLRIGSKRSFGKESAIDHVVMIILGGILGRAITGAEPFLPVMSAVFSIIIVHRLLAWICLSNKWLGNMINGEKKLLFADGKPETTNMKESLISKDDLDEGIRLRLNENNTDNVKEIFIERNGHLSVVKKPKTQGNTTAPKK
jgi:uncharacterized membrane protein YcaP (DUF421 family)